MRTFLSLSLLVLLAVPLHAQDAAADSTGLPGDHFSLQGALDLFKNAKDLESFEKALNTKDRQVNNLDLDGNGEVDYIRVVDHAEGDAHAIVLQVPMGKEEAQDVAVIELEKTGERTALVQIRGGEELYGPDVIIEPVEEKAEPAKGQGGPSAPEHAPYMHVWVNVWAWPCVTWIYGPAFVVWDSPWYWGYYPPWWHPWRPYPYYTFRGWHHHHYYGWYRPVNVCRVQRAHAIYGHRAMYSPRVRTATAPVRAQRAALRREGQLDPARQRRLDDRQLERREPDMRQARPEREQHRAPAERKPRTEKQRPPQQRTKPAPQPRQERKAPQRTPQRTPR